jgi:transcriptional regulator with XRE-family HTH domain
MMKGGLHMDQIKVGAFLKDLRKEKGITQEQLAEKLGVSGRTISRWETGKNMPDISLLVEIAEFFDVSIPEIIKGERKSENMKNETKEVAETMSDYAKAEKEQLIKSFRNMSIIGLIALLVYMVLRETGVYDRNIFLQYMYGISESLIYVTVLMFPLYTTGLLSKIRINRANYKFSSVPRPAMKVLGFIVAFAVAALIKIALSKLF